MRAALCSAAVAALLVASPSRGEIALSEVVTDAEMSVDGVAPGVRVDTSTVGDPAWRRAIESITATPAIKSGRTPVTLVRVILEGDPPVEATEPSPELPSVNGVRIRITGPGGVSIDIVGQQPDAPSNVQTPRAPIQVRSTKLNELSSFPQGGGMFRELGSGDFVIVEHINSTARRGGKDPVHIRTASHGQIDLWVPVPPRGELGVYGDVILPRIESSQMGRIVADIRSPNGVSPRAQRLEVGLVTVGGPYGQRFEMTHDHVAVTGLLAPGRYPILLPTDETPGTRTNRWEVTIEPGGVTYLTFYDPGEGEIRLQSTQTVRPENANRAEVLRALLER